MRSEYQCTKRINLTNRQQKSPPDLERSILEDLCHFPWAVCLFDTKCRIDGLLLLDNGGIVMIHVDAMYLCQNVHSFGMLSVF